MSEKVILTLTPDDAHVLRDSTLWRTLSESCRSGCSATVQKEDGTLLSDGRVLFVRLSILQSKPFLEVIIDAKPLISSERSAAQEGSDQSAGISSMNTSCTRDPNACHARLCDWPRCSWARCGLTDGL